MPLLQLLAKARPFSSVVKKENIATIPNLLTASRLFLSPYVGFLITQHSFEKALVGLAVCAATDFLDGWIARRYKQQTFLGSALDPMADKVLMTSLVVSLSHVNLLPVPLAALILARDVGLIAATAHVRYTSLLPPKTLKRYFDLKLPSAQVNPPFISKFNTFLQVILMAASLSAPVYGFTSHIGLDILRYTVATTTVWSGLHYFVHRKEVIKVLNKAQ